MLVSCKDNPKNDVFETVSIHCDCFKLCELMKRDEILPECTQCVNLNCTIGVQNYLAIHNLVKIKDIQNGDLKL